ncbi:MULTISPECIES: ribbon-helix-helix domain-containing protein [unclassified Coleofasciculus]|uniref:ribbon-helix-helix domain-containing protein n=1 Tax=Cyanophyceae TaxID=3028117 RepID=UPI001683369B|nr:MULTISPECIES: ribbon-helix-helix domain-containing protein [unclassified Coleofasciculus]MBD1880266.1 CopG family transcriptional regulator [Coleofasciculus sp. FACHB-T130]MBD1898649.1 CopG family transcriptional regulator [Coleofasciculus sp. FACHB-125]
MKRRLLTDWKPITAAIPFETIEKLDETADKLKVTRSIVIRAALDQYLEKQVL